MTVDEAIEEAVYLKSLFQKMPIESTDYWTDKFTKYGRDNVHRAIDRFADTHSDFVDRVGLLSLIETESGRGTDNHVDAMSAERQRENQEALKRRSASMGSVDRVLRNLSEAELTDLKEVVVSEAAEHLAPVLKFSDPKTGKALRFYMAERLQSATA